MSRVVNEPWIKKWEVFTRVWPARGAWVWFEPKTRTPKVYVPAQEGDRGDREPCTVNKDWQSIFILPDQKTYGYNPEEVLDALKDAVELARDEWYRSGRKEKHIRASLDSCPVNMLRNVSELGKRIVKRNKPEEEGE